jgi:hypothetical protein
VLLLLLLLMRLCLILQELMRKIVIMGIKVERRENRDFGGSRVHFPALVWSWRLRVGLYNTYIKMKLCFCTFRLCNLFECIQPWRRDFVRWMNLSPKFPSLTRTPVQFMCVI